MPAIEDAVSKPGLAAFTTLESRVEGVKTRHRAKFLGTGLCFGMAVFVAAFLGFSLADIVFKLSVGTRVFALLSTLIGVGVVVFWCVIRPWTRLGGSVQVARSVEGVYPQLEEQLSTALEYGRNPDLGVKTSSPELVGALMQQAANRAEPLDFGRTIRWKPLAIAFVLALLFAFGMAGYAGWQNGRLFRITLARFFQPTAAIAPPTLTVIKQVEPGSDAAKSEVPVESSVPVIVDLEGKLPSTATLSVFIPDEKDGRWEDRIMDCGEDGRYRATLRRLLDTTRYKIRANDAESPEFKIEVYKIPEISDFALRLEHPPYTGKGIETLAPGVGDVRALKGTVVHVELKANTDLASGKITFKSRRSDAMSAIDAADKRKAAASFKVEGDDEYQMHIANAKGKTGTGSLYPIKALKDKAPRVLIKKPEKDLMVHRAQTVQIEISADDDIGVGELGIFHSLGLEESKVMVRRLDPPAIHTDGKLVWELGNLGLKGGEVIAYYAYALDNDSITAPATDQKPAGKMAKSDIHFLTVYDEKEYDDEQSAQKKKNQQKGTPPAIKQLDKLIDVQKKLLKETFGQARQRDAAAPQPVSEPEKAAASKTADAQEKLRGQVQELLDKVKEELAKAEEAPEKPAEGDGPKPQDPGLGEEELKHMEAAIEKMNTAETSLKVPDSAKAVRPETEALRHLSETRRLLLSDKEGDPRFKMAMDKQSKKQKQKDQSQEQKDQEQAKQELAEMPKMMEKEQQLERELEQLNERKKKNPPPEQAQTEAQKREQEDQRRLQREKQEELEQLAREAEERARKLEQLAARNPDMQPAADKMQDAADKLKKAAEEAKQEAERNLKEAQQQTQEAQKDTKDSQRNLRNALEKQIRQELANLQKDAQDLAQRQQDVAQQARQLQNEQQQGQQPQQQQAQSQPQQGQQQAQPQQGQQQQQQGQQQQAQQQGQQPQQGQQQGKPQEGQQQAQQGQPQQGQQQAQNQPGATPEQRLKGMAGEQSDIRGELKELAERLDKLASRAAEKQLAGAQALEQAKQQAGESSPASQSAEKAQDALQAAKAADAQREATKAAKAMEQMASAIQEARQKTAAGDMKALAQAMKKVQGLAKEQGDLNKDIADKRDPAQLGDREDKVAAASREAADAADKLEMLRQNGRQGTTKEKLDEAAKQADATAKALKDQDNAAAKAPGEKAEKALNQALTEMERAAGKTLEEKAREAKSVARAARENQEKAAEAAKDIPAPKPNENLAAADAAKRDEAAAKEQQAAREAKRLDHALEGLQEIAKDANPAAAEAAREAREATEKAELPKAMAELAKGIEQIGDPKKAAENKDVKTPTPQEANKKGEELAQVVRNVEKGLDTFIAEATDSQLDRLKAMEAAAREAAKKAEELAKQNQDPNAKPQPDKKDQASKEQTPNAKGDPNQQTAQSKDGDPNAKGEPNPNAKGDPKGDPKESKTAEQKPGEQPDERATTEQLKKDMKRLEPKLQRLEANAPELSKMREALAELSKDPKEPQKQKTDPNGKPSPGPNNSGGPNFQRVAKDLDEVTGGLVNRIERILRAREIKPDEDEDAPKEYRALVDKYYRALSEDVEEEKK